MDHDPGLAIFDAVSEVHVQRPWRRGVEVGASLALLVGLNALGLLSVLAMANGVAPFVSWLLSVAGFVEP